MMRQRLVGALVLLCGGVILWTLLFTGPAEYKVDRQSQIPPEPRVDPVLGVSPERPGGIASADRPLVAPQPQLAPQDIDAEAEPAAEPDKQASKEASVGEDKPKSETPDTPAVVEPQPEKQPPAGGSMDDHGLAEAWVIQVGSFSKAANAESLKQRLQKGGHKAYIDKREYQGKPLYRVLVGPMLNRNTADSEKKNIDARFGVSSLVTRFEAKP